MHVVADAVTSIFAIIALIFGKYLGWDFLDAALGIVGSILVAKWALSLMQETGKTLLDAEMDHQWWMKFERWWQNYSIRP